jgi:hypothetical protein
LIVTWEDESLQEVTERVRPPMYSLFYADK